jgi:PPOX class probable F420-dependent enzyme
MALPGRDAFLSETRIGILTTLRRDGSPVAVPVWYEWDGERARIFSNGTSAKVGRLRRNSRASLLVTNTVGEPEYWVAIEGTAVIQREGAIELAERLAERYWDQNDPEHSEALAGWRKNASSLVMLELTPARTRAYGE